MLTVLVVSEDFSLRSRCRTALQNNGFAVREAADAQTGLAFAEHTYVDLVLSSARFSPGTCCPLMQALRAVRPDLPLLAIAAGNCMADKQKIFAAGADDYMVEPIDLNELVWRVKALLRRCHLAHSRVLTVGGTALSCDDYSVCGAGARTVLPPREFLLLYKLLSSTGQIFTRAQLMDELWGIESSSDPHTLEVHMGRLRTRFRENPDFVLCTVRGLGYKAMLREKAPASPAF